uniref:Uncharacterized protein n=1 Tax=viral metagenome TaxID=1070528 RepID=A0A6C0LZS4_9ZZZZ
MDIFQKVTAFIEKDINFFACGGNAKNRDHITFYNTFIIELEEHLTLYENKDTVATQLLWVVFGSVQIFNDDFSDILIRSSKDLSLLLVEFCINHGADVNSNTDIINSEQLKEHIIKIVRISSKMISINAPYSLPVVATIFALHYSYENSNKFFKYILSNITTPMNNDDILLCNKICIVDRLKKQKQSMIIMDIFRKYPNIYNNNIPYEILEAAIEHNDNFGVQYYLQQMKCLPIEYDFNILFKLVNNRSKGICIRLVQYASTNDLNTYDEQGNTLLLLACKNGNTSLVKIILQKNINVNICNKNGETPIYWACKNGNPHIVSLLLKNKVIETYDNILKLAKKYNRNTVIKVVLEFKYGKLWQCITRERIITSTNTKIPSSIINMIARISLNL